MLFVILGLLFLSTSAAFVLAMHSLQILFFDSTCLCDDMAVLLTK